jgi:2-amino-4-hydroxy-6-hydroxymethyldihydropteridine diphosphokinase
MASDVLIAVGSNIDPEINIPKALDLLNKRCPIFAVSTFYRSKAIEREDQPDFLNGACRCTGAWPPRELKYGVLRPIEAELGRVRTEDAHAAREIDLDIGLMGDCIVEDSDLSVPDPDIEKRAFLAVPFAELAPDAILPTTGRKLSDLAAVFDEYDLHTDSEFSDFLRIRFSK